MRRLPPGVVPVLPGPRQESVWDYPRPPRLAPSSKRVVVTLGGVVVVDTVAAIRVLETSHPPAWYLPLADALAEAFVPVSGTSFCEWKGVARYLDVTAGGVRAARGAWVFPEPTPGYGSLREHVSLYPALMDGCTVDGEVVRPQEGGFYGGWITDDVVGPFKGPPGSQYW